MTDLTTTTLTLTRRGVRTGDLVQVGGWICEVTHTDGDGFGFRRLWPVIVSGRAYRLRAYPAPTGVRLTGADWTGGNDE